MLLGVKEHGRRLWESLGGWRGAVRRLASVGSIVGRGENVESKVVKGKTEERRGAIKEKGNGKIKPKEEGHRSVP